MKMKKTFLKISLVSIALLQQHCATPKPVDKDKVLQEKLVSETNSIKMRFDQSVLDTLSAHNVDLNELIIKKYIPKLKKDIKTNFKDSKKKLTDLPLSSDLKKYFPTTMLSKIYFVGIDKMPSYKELLTDAGIDQKELEKYKLKIDEKTWASKPDAFTVGDTIYIENSQVTQASAFFHECVHVAQTEKLGVEKYLTVYLYSLLSGVAVDQIPFEQAAYYLQGKFEKKEVFDVMKFLSKIP